MNSVTAVSDHDVTIRIIACDLVMLIKYLMIRMPCNDT